MLHLDWASLLSGSVVPRSPDAQCLSVFREQRLSTASNSARSRRNIKSPPLPSHLILLTSRSPTILAHTSPLSAPSAHTWTTQNKGPLPPLELLLENFRPISFCHSAPLEPLRRQERRERQTSPTQGPSWSWKPSGSQLWLEAHEEWSLLLVTFGANVIKNLLNFCFRFQFRGLKFVSVICRRLVEYKQHFEVCAVAVWSQILRSIPWVHFRSENRSLILHN